jgi:molybdopterin synthase catalytic subunit
VTAPTAAVSDRVALVESPIDVAAVQAKVAHAGAGGIALFCGAVRNEAEGRAVVLLEYEAYRPMALTELQRCVDDVEGRFAGQVRLAVTHRIGALKVGDLAVVCAAASKHRGEAFDACRALIDEVKARVPIWKREHGPEGAWWVGWRDARCDAEGHTHLHPHEGHTHEGRGHR